MTASRPLVVAHRGGASLADGDVVEGIRRLVELGVDAVEFDVRRTNDRTLVVHHDEDWNGVRLDRLTYEELVSRGCPLRRLDEVLAAARSLALDVELKETGYEAEVLSLLLEQVEPERLIVTSFLDEVVRAVKRDAPAIRAGLLVGRRLRLYEPLAPVADVFPFRRLERCRADFLAPSVALLSTGLGRRARRRGLPLLLWTVNQPNRLRRYLLTEGVLGVVTDSATAGAVSSSGSRPRWPFPPDSP